MTPKLVLKPGRSHPISVEPTPHRVTVTVGGRVVADTRRAVTLQEASYPAVQYIPLADVDPAVLRPSEQTSYCPYKGEASYFDLAVGDRVAPGAVWTYPAPHEPVSPIRDHVAFYPDRVDSIDVHADA